MALTFNERNSAFQAVGAQIRAALEPPNGTERERINDAQHEALRHVISRVPQRFAIISMATGTGKTGVAIIASYYLQCKRILVVAPRPVLADQIDKELRGDLANPKRIPFLVKIGLVSGEGTWRPVTDVVRETRELSGTLNSVNRFDAVVTNTKKWGTATRSNLMAFQQGFFDLVIIDEAHELPSTTIKSVYDHFRALNVMTLLLTATPFRADKQRLLPGLSEAQHREATFYYGIAQAADDGVIRRVCEVPIFAPRNPRLERDPAVRHVVRLNHPQLAPDSSVVDDYTIQLGIGVSVLDAVAQQLAADDVAQPGVLHLGLVAASNKFICKMLEEVSMTLFPQLQAAAYNSETGGRARVLNDFQAGTRRVLFIVGCLIQGFDESKISVVGMLKPSTSAVRYSQLIGRAIRKHTEGGIADSLTANVVTSAMYGRLGQRMHKKYRDEEFGVSQNENADEEEVEVEFNVIDDPDADPMEE